MGKAVSSLKAKFHISWTFFLNVPFLFLTERLISLRVLLSVACFCPTISHSNFQVIVPPSSLLMPSDYTNNYMLLVCSLTSVSIKPFSTSHFLEMWVPGTLMLSPTLLSKYLVNQISMKTIFPSFWPLSSLATSPMIHCLPYPPTPMVWPQTLSSVATSSFTISTSSMTFFDTYCYSLDTIGEDSEIEISARAFIRNALKINNCKRELRK